MFSITSKVIIINKRKTSIRLTQTEWSAINEICKTENIKRKKLFELIEANHNLYLSLTYAIKLFMLIYYHKSVIKQNETAETSNLNPIFEAIKGIV